MKLKNYFLHPQVEIERKPLVTELVQTVNDSTEYLNSLPSTSTSNARKRQKPKHNCEICSQGFRTVADLTRHRQQGCEGLIEMDSITIDCKPTAVDFYTEMIEHPAIDNDDATNIIDGQSMNSENVANRHKQKVSADRNKLTQNKTNNHENNRMKQSDGQATNKRFTCEVCGQIYKGRAGLNYHMEKGCHVNRSLRSKKCPLCSKT